MIKNIVLIAVAVILYTALLLNIGVFGVAAAAVAHTVSLFILKWGAILGGYAFAIFLPLRIIEALKLRTKRAAEIEQENKKTIEHNKKVAAAEKQQEDEIKKQELESKILKAYYKQEDEI